MQASVRWPTHQDEEDVQAVPEVPEVVEAVQADLQGLLHHIVKHEEAEGHLAQPHEHVPAGGVAHQAHRLELPGGESAPCGRELHQQPEDGGDGVGISGHKWTNEKPHLWAAFDTMGVSHSEVFFAGVTHTGKFKMGITCTSKTRTLDFEKWPVLV